MTVALGSTLATILLASDADGSFSVIGAADDLTALEGVGGWPGGER